MTSEESKFEILKKVQEGVLSPEEGADLLAILDGAATGQEAEPDSPVEVVGTPFSDERPPEPSWLWKAAWSLFMWLGVILTILSAFWMYKGYEAAGMGWGFFLSWIPFTLGILLVYGGTRLLQAHWMHIKIDSTDEGKPRRINIEAPLPLNFAAWIFKNFGQYLPADIQDKKIGEMLDEIEKSIQRDEPFYVKVDDDKDGDRVEVVIA